MTRFDLDEIVANAQIGAAAGCDCCRSHLDALERMQEIVAIARRWADADTPTLAILAAVDLRHALAADPPAPQEATP